MGTLPTIPSFTVNDSSITKLQQLSYCAQWLTDCDIRPLWHYYFLTGNQSIAGSNAWTTVNFGHTAIDSDGVSGATPPGYQNASTPNLPAAIIQTQGRYSCEGCVEFSTGTAFNIMLRFLVTAGSGNPNLTTGATLVFGVRESGTCQSFDTTVSTQDVCPIALYPGDSIVLQAAANTATTLVSNQTGAGAFTQRFGPYFSGIWLNTAT